MIWRVQNRNLRLRLRDWLNKVIHSFKCSHSSSARLLKNRVPCALCHWESKLSTIAYGIWHIEWNRRLRFRITSYNKSNWIVSSRCNHMPIATHNKNVLRCVNKNIAVYARLYCVRQNLRAKNRRPTTTCSTIIIVADFFSLFYLAKSHAYELSRNIVFACAQNQEKLLYVLPLEACTSYTSIEVNCWHYNNFIAYKMISNSNDFSFVQPFALI